MGIAYGFYAGVFFSSDSPLYEPSDDKEPEYGVCFAPVGQAENYHGFLYETAELLANYILYA